MAPRTLLLLAALLAACEGSDALQPPGPEEIPPLDFRPPLDVGEVDAVAPPPIDAKLSRDAAMDAGDAGTPERDAAPDAAPDATPDDAAALPHVRVATANLRCLVDGWAERRPLIVASIAALDPDVIALQEVCRDPQTGEDTLDGLLPDIAAATGREYAVHRAVSHLAWDRYEEGVALVAATPLEGAETVELPPGAFPRRAVIARVQTPIGPLLMAATHLSFGDQLEVRVAQLRAVRARIAARATPGDLRLLAGDFNQTPGGAPIAEAVADGYVDLWAAAHPGGAGATYPANDPRDRIDYLMLAGGEAVEASVGVFMHRARGGVWPSDHFGVWADLKGSPPP